MMYQGLYGGFPFTVTEAEVCTFRDLKRGREFAYAEHAVINGLTKLQTMGRNLDTLTLNIQVFPLTPLSTVAARLLALDLLFLPGLPLPLVLGLTWYGLYVPKSREVTHRIMHNGVIMSAEVALSLQEWN